MVTRYWTKEFDSLNPHFATPVGSKELSSDLHERGMYLILNTVNSHMAAPGSNSTFTDFSQLFNDSSSFHNRPIRSTRQPPSSAGSEISRCHCPISIRRIPSFLDRIHELVQDYDVDGLGVDTVKHIRSF